MVKAIKPFNKIITHKWWVMVYCFKCGLYYQGIVHDISKFSPIEFWESVKYYQGDYSPIDACKKVNGYSNAWFHHKGRNKHHWEYWLDISENGDIKAIKMPYKYALEMICDFLGAGRAYYGKSFTIQSEYDWWQKKRRYVIMHPKTYLLIDTLFVCMHDDGIDYVFKQKQWLKEVMKSQYENK